MTDTVRAGAGIALMAAGMAAVGHAVYLEMSCAVPLPRWDRGVVLAPVRLVAILGGLLLFL